LANITLGIFMYKQSADFALLISGMRIRQKRIQNFLFMAITLFLVVHPAFHEFENQREIELSSRKPVLAHTQFEDMASGESGKFQGLNSNCSAFMLLLEPNLLKNFFHHPFPILSSSQQDPVLRC